MRLFIRVPLVCNLYSKGLKSVCVRGEPHNLCVTSELVVRILVPCGLSKQRITESQVGRTSRIIWANLSRQSMI